MVKFTVELLCRCTGHAIKRKRDENHDNFLARITHLYCSDKGIEKIESLDRCRNLLVIYLYDNKINKLEGLKNNTSLTHLYLQNNYIEKMENLSHLNKLTKLYLSHNNIRVLEGLENLIYLTELHIAHQKLPAGEKLLIDPRSMRAVSHTLTVLNVSDNNLDSLEDFTYLTELQQFVAANNNLQKMKKLSKVLSRLPKLWKLDLSGNPLASQHKYRDRVVTMCFRLEMFDGREVSELERQFLFSWKAMRKARHRYQQQMISNNNYIRPEMVLPSSRYVAPTIPPLPARRPMIRLQQQIEQQKTKQTHKQQQTEAEKFHLPPLNTSDSKLNMVASSFYYSARKQGLDPYNRHQTRLIGGLLDMNGDTPALINY